MPLLHLSEEGVGLILKSLRRMAQRHRGAGALGGTEYDQLCSEIEGQLGYEPEQDDLFPEEEHERELAQVEDWEQRRHSSYVEASRQGSGHVGSPFDGARMPASPDIAEYKFYVFVDGRIESGWEYKEDAQERITDLREEIQQGFSSPSLRPTILTRRTLVQRGLDPKHAASWLHASQFEGLLESPHIERLRTSPKTGRWPEGTPGTQVQTLLLDKDVFTKKQAKAWARNHNFRYGKVDETASYYRLRQGDPTAFRKDTFRTIDFRPGVKAVVAVPR